MNKDESFELIKEDLNKAADKVKMINISIEYIDYGVLSSKKSVLEELKLMHTNTMELLQSVENMIVIFKN